MWARPTAIARGFHGPGPIARGALAGLVLGTLLSTTWTLGGYGKLWGWHAGVVSAAANLAIAVLASVMERRRDATIIVR